MMIVCWFQRPHRPPPRFGWRTAVAIHAALAFPVSLAHIALMVGFRMLSRGVSGGTYHFEIARQDAGLYELRRIWRLMPS